nr:MAG TPA: hypothetical protein [Caudoviricetes sp.]
MDHQIQRSRLWAAFLFLDFLKFCVDKGIFCVMI